MSKESGNAGSQQTAQATGTPDPSAYNMANDPEIDQLVSGLVGSSEEDGRRTGDDQGDSASEAMEALAGEQLTDTDEDPEAPTEPPGRQQKPPTNEDQEEEDKPDPEEDDETEDSLFDLLEEPEDKKSRSRFQKRIDELTARSSAKDKKIKELETQLAQATASSETFDDSPELTELRKKQETLRGNLDWARGLVAKVDAGRLDEVETVFREAKITPADYSEEGLRKTLNEVISDLSERYNDVKLDLKVEQRARMEERKALSRGYQAKAVEVFPWMRDAKSQEYAMATQILRTRQAFKSDPAWPIWLGGAVEAIKKIKALEKNGSNGSTGVAPVPHKGIRPAVNVGGGGAATTTSRKADRLSAAGAAVDKNPTSEALLNYVDAMLTPS